MKTLDNFIIRGSSTGVYRNGEFYTGSDVGCPRKTILRHLNIQQTVSEKTKEIFNIGFIFEEWFCSQFPDAIKEKEVNSSMLQGHCDLVSDEFVYELKSCTSKNTYKTVFKDNKPKVQNIIQLVTYMIELEMNKGKLVYGSYVHVCDYSKLMKMQSDQIKTIFDGAVPVLKEFNVEIEEDGTVLVNGEHFHNLNVTEILDFQINLHELVKKKQLPPMVEALDQTTWDSPCKWCPLQALCESAPDLETFIDTAEKIFEESN
jgi:hypothetical protein